MAEFRKKCFVKKLMTTDERRKLDAGQILIFESDWNDFCEGCGSIGPVVEKVRKNDESRFHNELA